MMLFKSLLRKLIMKVDSKLAILKLRNAMLFIILGSVILSLGVLAVLAYSIQIKGHVYSDLVIPLLLLLAGGVIVFLGALDIYRGFKVMQNIDRTYDFGEYGALAQFTASILLIIGFYLLVFSDNTSVELLGSGFTLVGYVIGAICASPVGIAFHKLGEKYNSSVVKYGSFGYILLPIIGPLILYFGLNEIATR